MRTGIAITNADRTNGDSAATADTCTGASQTRRLRALAQVMDGGRSAGLTAAGRARADLQTLCDRVRR